MPVLATKIDLTKQDKNYYTAKTYPSLIELSRVQGFSIIGQGTPDSPPFASAVEALYPLAYQIKKICKQTEQDFAVLNWKASGGWNPKNLR